MADNAVVFTEKKTKRLNSLTATTGSVVAREFSFLLPSAAAQDETYTTTMPVLPAGALVTGCYIKTSAQYGGTATIALKSTTTGAVFAAAATSNGTADVFVSKTVTTPVVTSTADEKVTLTVAAAAGATVAGGVTVTVLVTMIAYGVESGTYSTITT